MKFKWGKSKRANTCYNYKTTREIKVFKKNFAQEKICSGSKILFRGLTFDWFLSSVHFLCVHLRSA